MRTLVALGLALLLSLAAAFGLADRPAAAAQGGPAAPALLLTTPTSGPPTLTPTPLAPSPAILLSVEPAVIHAGDAFTLHLAYQNIGMPYTTVTSSPVGLTAFDPPLAMPCKYNQHPTGCRDIGMRALGEGQVALHAGATGEIFDPACGCWRWGAASSQNLVVTIVPADVPPASPTATPTPAIEFPTDTPTPSATPDTTPSLTLSLSPGEIMAGDVFTLNIQYNHISIPNARISVSPEGRMVFDPPLAMPCQSGSHAYQCRAIRMRAVSGDPLAGGPATITVHADGEIFPPGCGCSSWGFADGAISTTIAPAGPEPTPAATTTPTPFAGTPTPPPPALFLSVEPDEIRAGDAFTLHIQYQNIGMPYTGISFSEPGMAIFEPAMQIPCKYNEHPNGCTAIGLRALSGGQVTIRAGATGEVSCGFMCWQWGYGSAEPLSVTIQPGSRTPTRWYLPMQMR